MKTPKAAKSKTLKDAKKPKAAQKKSPLSTYFAENQPKHDFRHPSLSLLAKLGSVAVHADELLSPDVHSFDRTALEQILRDPEVTAWIKAMGPLLPRKRSS